MSRRGLDLGATAIEAGKTEKKMQHSMLMAVERRRDILGISVLAASGDEVVAVLDAAYSEARQIGVAYLNAHTANVAVSSRNYRECLGRFLVLNDGIGVDLASKVLYGRAFPENLNGTEFTPRYLNDTRHNFRIFLLGAKQASVSTATERIARDYPKHQVVGYRDGYFSSEDCKTIAQQIKDCGADVLLVAMGNPRQELWIHEYLEASGVRLAFAVGALFDFISGVVPRSPGWMIAIRAEWLFRLALEPKRLWRRYLIGNAAFLFSVLRQKMGRVY